MSRRLMIHVPEIHAESFVFFFYQGKTGAVFSIRDYSRPGPARLRYAASFSYAADQILALTQRSACFSGFRSSRSTSDKAWWWLC